MAGSAFTPKSSSDLDDLNVNFNMDPRVFGEEFSNENQGTTSQSGEGVAGNASTGNLPVDDEFAGLGSLTTNENFDPSIPVSNENDPFLGSLAPEPNQVATNFPNIEEDDLFKVTNEEQEAEFHRLMEMSPEEFEKMMSEFPDGMLGPSSATPYAISNKRARRDEEEFAETAVESAQIAPQPAFEPQQIHQIRQIREVKSRRGKVIEGLQKRVQDLEAELAKSRAEVNDALENGRIMTLLGLRDEWEAKEAKIKGDATSALTQQHGQLEEANREIAEKNKRLNDYRAEAEAYKANVEDEARRYKLAAEEEIQAQNEAVKAAERAKNRVETQLSEQTRILDLAKPYVEGLEKRVADYERERANWEAAERLREPQAQPTAIRALEGKIQELEAVAEKRIVALGESEKAIKRLDEEKAQTENACANQKKLLDESQSYAKDLEKRLADLEREQSSKEVAQRRREEDLERSGTEVCKALEGKNNDLEAAAEKASRAQDNSAQATKSLNEELNRLSGDLIEAQLALTTKADELEKARSALKEQAKTQTRQQLRETQSVVGPVEQINIEPSCPHSAYGGTTSVGNSFTFAAAKELVPPSHLGNRQIHSKKSRRQRQPQPQPRPEPQTQSEQEPAPELDSALPLPQLGMFSHHFYSPAVAANSRPRRSHIHVEEAIRNRLHIPLNKVHTIVSKLDNIGDGQDGMAEIQAGLIISAELTGLSIEDLKVMQNLRISIPGRSSSSRNPRKVMNSAQLEIPRTLVDLLATDDRLAISAFLDGASFPQRRGSNEIASGTESRGTQTKASDAEAKGKEEKIAGQEEVTVAQPTSSLWKSLIFLGLLLWFILPLLMPSPWSSPVAWIFNDPDPNSGWLDYVPEPSPWSNLFPPNFSRWPIISNIFDFFFDRPDLESKWCGNIPIE